MNQSIESSESSQISPPDRLEAQWPIEGLAHGFLGRLGGVSRGRFASLNLSYLVGDETASVDRNWQIARESIPAGALIAKLNQVHGAEVRCVSGADRGARPDGDGLVTAAPGIVLTILTADCVPLLMVDAERRVAAALHAGWRGTLAGIAAAGVDAMVSLGASPAGIRAALGPSIGPCCFEVDAELATRFADRFEFAAQHIHAGRAGKAFIDLRGVLRDQLVRCGLDADAIASVGPCTRCAGDRYFSRRASGGNLTGLQLSYIGFGPGSGS
ncbi:MAG: peptidoglycan editing factor PgeF [Candidatus Binatales bacterium]